MYVVLALCFIKTKEQGNKLQDKLSKLRKTLELSKAISFRNGLTDTLVTC